MAIKIINTYVAGDDYYILMLDGGIHEHIEIKLDACDVEKCKQKHWGGNKIGRDDNKVFYIFGNSSKILLHRYIMDCPKDMIVDHINGDTLDNRRSNLRICTRQQNNMNKRMQKNNTSGYIGVCWYQDRGINKWMASIAIEGKNKTLGYFINMEDAISVRKDAEIKYFGEYARDVIIDKN